MSVTYNKVSINPATENALAIIHEKLTAIGMTHTYTENTSIVISEYNQTKTINVEDNSVKFDDSDVTSGGGTVLITITTSTIKALIIRGASGPITYGFIIGDNCAYAGIILHSLSYIANMGVTVNGTTHYVQNPYIANYSNNILLLPMFVSTTANPSSPVKINNVFPYLYLIYGTVTSDKTICVDNHLYYCINANVAVLWE